MFGIKEPAPRKKRWTNKAASTATKTNEKVVYGPVKPPDCCSINSITINSTPIFNPNPRINTTACHISATHGIPMNEVTINPDNPGYKYPAMGLAGALGGIAASGASAGLAPAAAANADKVVQTADYNKLNHIFGKAQHNLGNFLGHYGGDQAKAFNAIQNATQQHITVQRITGVFEEVVKVNGTMITVRGNVVDGVAKIGTAFIP